MTSQTAPDFAGQAARWPAVRGRERLLVVPLLLLFAVVLVRTAWLSEDAFITFRTAENWLNGYGLTWNVAERVQTFTHPLWFMAVTAAVALTREYFYTVIGLTLIISAAASVLFAARGARTTAGAVAGMALLSTSAAFVDYATSGLENPLTHLLLIAFYALFFRAETEADDRPVWPLALIAGLAALNRLDTLLLFLPALAYALGRVQRGVAANALLVGFLPLLLWIAFSTYYYGFPFPNTAYAKLSTGLDRLELVRQGLYYLGHSLRFDPPAALGLAAGAAVPFVTRRPRHWLAAAGVALYLLYVVAIGGDFMRGRFLTGPLVIAVMLVADVAYRRQRAAAAVALLAVAVATLLSPAPPLLGSREYGRRPGQLAIDRGIADERAYYYPALGLLNGRRDTHSWQTEGEQARAAGPAVIEKANAGLFGFYAGPQVHVLDPLALGDPLLARLPVADPADWRIGHFRRAIPAGYAETLRTGRNEIADPDLAAYYDVLALATRGSPDDPRRLAAVWELNLGRHDALLDAYLARQTVFGP